MIPEDIDIKLIKRSELPCTNEKIDQKLNILISRELINPEYKRIMNI